MKTVLQALFAAIALLGLAVPAHAQTYTQTQAAQQDQPPAAVSGRVGSAAATAVPALPSELSGKWRSTVNTRVANAWKIENIDHASGSVKVTWWSRGSGNCAIIDMPMALEVNGAGIKISATDTKMAYMHCGQSFVAELTPSGGKWVGKIQTDSLGRFGFLETEMEAK